MNRASTTKVKRTVLKHRRGRGMVLPKETHTHTHTHTLAVIFYIRGITKVPVFSLRNKRFELCKFIS